VNFGLLNLILTVIVDQANRAREEDNQLQLAEREETFQKTKKKLTEICACMDDDKSGHLTCEELYDGFDSNESFAQEMKLMDVQKDDFKMIFNILDADHSGSVTYTEFIEQLHRMKTEDTHMMLTMIRFYINDLREQVAEFVKDAHQQHENSLKEHHETISNLMQQGGLLDVAPASQEKKLMEPDLVPNPPRSLSKDALNLDQSLAAFKQDLDKQLASFTRDISAKIDTSMEKYAWDASQNRSKSRGAGSWFGTQVVEPDGSGTILRPMPPDGPGQDYSRLPPPPSYQGVCGGMMLNKTSKGLPS
jgi:Ca2+-binding EF-hand superfamily protein